MIDHIIYAAPDLDAACAHFRECYGVTPQAGGTHPGFGTRNALVGLGPDRYLEIMTIDPDQPEPAGGRLFGLGAQFAPRFVAWCARAARPLEETIARAQGAHFAIGDVVAMSRTRTDGTLLAWTMTTPRSERAGGVLPFYIDWGISSTPAATLPQQLGLSALTLRHPEPDRIRAILAALGENGLTVELGSSPAIVPTLS